MKQVKVEVEVEVEKNIVTHRNLKKPSSFLNLNLRFSPYLNLLYFPISDAAARNPGRTSGPDPRADLFPSSF